MLPNGLQRRELRKWFAGARSCYNRTVELLREKAPANTIELRKQVITKAAVRARRGRKGESLEWILDVPSRVLASAVKDAVTARKAAMTNLAEGHVKRFRLGFRSYRRTATETIAAEKEKVVHGISLPAGGTCPADTKTRARRELQLSPQSPLGRLGTITLRDSRKVMEYLDTTIPLTADCKIHWHKRTNRFYLLVPRDVVPQEAAAPTVPAVVSMDPGVRAFQTYYTPTGETGELLEGAMDEQLIPLAKRIDRGRSVMAELEAQRKKAPLTAARRAMTRELRGLRRREGQLWAKLGHRREAAHYAAIKYLWENFDAVLCPTFGSQRMVAKGTRVMGKKSVREMMTFAHRTFERRLADSAIYKTSRRVYAVAEGFTTKTCGLCGTVNNKVGAAKTFVCTSSTCGARIGRDVNGARNIMLRAVFHGPCERRDCHAATDPSLT
jgi:transposase